MKPIIQEMARLHDHGEDFALATVIARNGSAPRSTGAKMLVKQNGEITGTVGGGLLEAQVQRLAAEVLLKRRATIQSFAFDNSDAANMDAICGGQVEVLVEWVQAADAETAAVVEGLQQALSRHQKAWLITTFSEAAASTSHALLHPDGTCSGAVPAGLAVETMLETRLPECRVTGPQRILIEPVNIAGTAYIFGAGHVSRSLAEFVKAVGFWTVILDDRADFASRERFPGADELVVLDSFADIGAKITGDRDSYVVIVTRGHMNDRTVLAQVLKLPVGYIGMIGSRRKCALIFDDLRREGYTDEDIQRVHAPIGVAIQAETPEEIGISIAAEMIRERAAIQKLG
jgi:xanthine dehydrogenase accessory factor